MDRIATSIAQRLSLRAPQREGLDILSRLAGLVPLHKAGDGDAHDPARTLAAVRAAFPAVDDFERDFPSVCFALATGVGKTRLMGAFITYLRLAHGLRHFFVLAPNLTIYGKLIADFTPGTPKYVFQGVAEFAIDPPILITGDNYQSGAGIRGTDLFGNADTVHINIFNISKINSEVRGGKAPRIKRLSEYIGESYFDYLSRLDDLVLLMDESHRYRASAGIRAINELKPVLGLEVTATPWTEGGGRQQPFRNVIYGYPLHQAMVDGFVKEPAVATRENFNPAALSEEELERIKLEDAATLHESVKADLVVYASNSGRPLVKPFILVVAQDTGHANRLLALLTSDAFRDGRYRGRTIMVHSAQSGEEKDETVERLLAVENPREPTEIVIHVNMLKEGWDVTNLYTIVPLRAANSRTLVEQSIGRGLRLPYGRRTGVAGLDRLTIVAHDRFDEIIREANDRKSFIRSGIVIGRDIASTPRQAIEIRPRIEQLLAGPGATDGAPPSDSSDAGSNAGAGGKTSVGVSLDVSGRGESGADASGGCAPERPLPPAPLFSEPERPIARAALEALRDFERLPDARSLRAPDVLRRIAARVEEQMLPAGTQGTLADVIVPEADVGSVVGRLVEAYIAHTIDIPRIIVTPVGGDGYRFPDFDLDLGGLPSLTSVPDDILIRHLRTVAIERMAKGEPPAIDQRPEDPIVSALIDYNDISYDHHATLLYKLAGQMLTHIRAYAGSDAVAGNIIQFHAKRLAAFIHAQMEQRVQPLALEYRATVSRGFERPRLNAVTIEGGERIRHFRDTVGRDTVGRTAAIRGMVFGGFAKCLYSEQKFDSDPERQLAVLLEDDPTVTKWFKPGRTVIRIHTRDQDGYEPDFVIETVTEKLLLEVKRADELSAVPVQAKAEAARYWCACATRHALEHAGKPWRYLLIPHDVVGLSATLDGLCARFATPE